MIGRAIQSALDAAGDLPVDLIVVDDASTDDTWEVLRACDDPRVRCFRMDRNGGQSAARNRGLDEARGTYVKFLDSDDLLVAGHLAAEVRALQSSDAGIAVSGWYSETGGNTTTSPAPVFDVIIDDILAGRAVPTSQRCTCEERNGAGIPTSASSTTGTTSARPRSAQNASSRPKAAPTRCASTAARA